MSLPIDHEWAGKTSQWYRGDNAENYKKNQPNPYGPVDIVYRFNEYGFRCPEFKESDPSPVCFYGDSIMEGYGLPEEDTIPFQWNDLQHEDNKWLHDGALSPDESHICPVYNLGKASSSNDLIARTILTTAPLLQPHAIVVYWTYFTRRDLWLENGTSTRWIKRWRERSVPISAEEVDIYQAHDVISNKYADIANFISNYMLVKYFCGAQNIDMIWSLADDCYTDEIMDILRSQHLAHNYFSAPLKDIQEDFSRDMMHPGKKSVSKIAKAAWDVYAR